jgi:hypothetical protein
LDFPATGRCEARCTSGLMSPLAEPISTPLRRRTMQRCLLGSWTGISSPIVGTFGGAGTSRCPRYLFGVSRAFGRHEWWPRARDADRPCLRVETLPASTYRGIFPLHLRMRCFRSPCRNRPGHLPHRFPGPLSPVRTAASVDVLRRPRCRTAFAVCSRILKESLCNRLRTIRPFLQGWLCSLKTLFSVLARPCSGRRSVNGPATLTPVLVPASGLRLASTPCGASARRATSAEPRATPESRLWSAFGRSSRAGSQRRETPSGVPVSLGPWSPAGADAPGSATSCSHDLGPAISLVEGMAPVGGFASRHTAVSHDERCGDPLLLRAVVTDRCLLGVQRNLCSSTFRSCASIVTLANQEEKGRRGIKDLDPDEAWSDLTPCKTVPVTGSATPASQPK